MRVLVTGSSQGIGKAIAKAFAERGDEVIIHGSRNLEKAERVRAEVGGIKAIVADLSKPDEVDGLFEQTGAVDCLVLNASVQCKEPWTDVKDETLNFQLDVNVKSTLKLMQAYLPYMKERGFGRIVTIGSVNQYRQHFELSVYSATKCAVMSLVKNVAKQVAPYGITVNNVSPGAIKTPRNADVHQNAQKLSAVEKSIPMGRFGEPEECAGAILMLCSEAGNYITGIDIIIDGGMSL